MSITINYTAPHEPFGTELASRFSEAVRIEISVAFVTRYGFDFLKNCLNEKSSVPELRFVASVRYPTNLDRMADFAMHYPGKVWIHMGGLTPQETNGDRYQLHSKVFRFEDSQGNVTVHIGSHNLTAAALCGVNIEIGACVHCATSDQIARDVTEHIESSINESEPFDPRKLDFYKAAQAILQGKQASSQLLGEFERDECLVILAEAADPNLLNYPELQLFFSPYGKKAARDLSLGRKVSLYLYPDGTLFTHHTGKPPHSDPIYFEGEITMVNDNKDAAVTSRPINSLIENMELPTVEPASTIPPRHTGEFQFVALLKREAQKEIPAYHVGAVPKIKAQLEYSERTDLFRSLDKPKVMQEYFTKDSIRQDSFFTQVPSSLVSHVTLNIPNRDNPEIYQFDPLRRLEVIDAQRISDLSLRRVYDEQSSPRKKDEWETEFFYHADYSRRLDYD
jgi:HKD family nuclease